MAVIDVARARQDDRLAESYREILDTILMAFAADSPFRRWLGYGNTDLRPIVEAVSQMARTATGLPERAERGLNFMLDAGEALSAELTGELLKRAVEAGFRPLEAQARRG